MSHSNSLSDLQESQVKEIKERQKWADQILQKLAEFLDEGKQQQEEAVRRIEAELRQQMEIPKEYWPPLKKSLKEIMENMEKQINFTEQTLSQSQNLPDRELVRWASGGLTLQGIYITSSQQELLENREELLSVPDDFLFSGPKQGTRLETKEFRSSQAESKFTQTIEKLGFSVSALAKGSGWGFNLETGVDHNKHSESNKTKQSHDEHSYFCSTKFMYVPLASCHFLLHQLKLSKAAFQELKSIEKILSLAADPDRVTVLRHRTANFFQRFGSHANQGPLHFGGIYWWKAISEGFESEQLTEVKQQSVEMLDNYIKGSYSILGMTAAAGLDVSSSHSDTAFQNKAFKTIKTRVQLSITQTGGPLEANSLAQWKTGLVASNRTWCVIDRGCQLVPVWEIILSNHKCDFNEPFQIANCLRENYNYLTGLSAQLPAGEHLLSAEKEARTFLETVKSWEVSDPEEYLKQLIEFMHVLNEKVKNYDIWISICLTDSSLQKFLLSAVNFCKNSPMYYRQFIKFQLRSLLDPYIYSVKNFPQKDFIMKWIFQSESEKEDINITQFSDLVKMLKQTQSELIEVKAKSQSPKAVEEAQRKATYEISVSLGCFLNYLQVTQQTDRQHLLLSIAANVGYNRVNNTFQYLLGGEELYFLLHEMKTAHDKHQQLQNTCSCRAQAFLLLTVLTTTFGVRAISSEEKTQRLALTRQHMGQSLTTEVVQVLNKHREYPDWENLEKDLIFLINGENEATMLSLQMDDVKKELQSLLQENKPSKEICATDNYTQKVMAMSKLETMYNCCTWYIRSHVLGLQDQLMNQIQNGNLQTLQTSMLETQVSQNYDLIKQKMEKYFEDDPDSEILIQWKVNFENKLIILKKALISEVQRKVQAMINLKKSQKTLDGKKSTYTKEIVKKSQKLALSVKGQKLSTEKLYQIFDQLWKNWVCDVTSNHQPVPEPDIDKDIEDILLDHFNKEYNIVGIIYNKYGEIFQIKYDKHVQMNKKYFFILKLEERDKVSINMITKRICLRFSNTIDKIQRQQQDYNSHYFHEILRIIEEEVKSTLTKERYTFKTEYKIVLSLSLFKGAAKTFKEMHRAFKEANDPVNYLERKKDEFFMSFKISCEGATNIKTSVDFLWNKLTPAISTTLWRNLVFQMAAHIRGTCSEFNANRSNLEKYILISLAEEENFENYWQYIHDPQSFFKSFILRYVQKYYSGAGSKKIKPFLKQNLENIKQIIRSAIHDSTEIAKDKNSNETASEWLNVFCDKLGSDFAFPRKDLLSIEHQEIKDIYFLRDAMSAALDPAMKDLEQKCLSMSKEKEMSEVSEILSEHLCGCWVQCPFCNAICTNTIPNHDGDHSVPFHRSKAVTGMKFYKTDHFLIDFCTTSVASDSAFILNENNMFPYKTYRDTGGIYATWNITPDSSIQSYWKWFVCHFRSQLEEKYHLKFKGKGQIPFIWNMISKKTVLDELKKQ